MKRYLVVNVAAWNEEIGRMAELTVEFPGGRQQYVVCVDDSVSDSPVWSVTAESARELPIGVSPTMIDSAETREDAEASPYHELYKMAESALNLLSSGELEVL